MPTYRYAPAAPSVRDIRQAGGNDDARRRGDVEVKPLTPPPTQEPEPTPASISPEASPAAEPAKRKRGRPRKVTTDE